jgi:hypothetical protein
MTSVTSTSSSSSSSSLSPFALHKAAMRESRRAFESIIESEGKKLSELLETEEELYEFRRCRQLRVPLAATPRSIGVAAATWAAISAASHLPFSTLSTLISSRASLSLSSGLLYFNAMTAPNSSLSEICYLFAFSGNTKAGQILRSSYNNVAGNQKNDFITIAEELSSSSSPSLTFTERVSALVEVIPEDTILGLEKKQKNKKLKQRDEMFIGNEKQNWNREQDLDQGNVEFNTGSSFGFENDIEKKKQIQEERQSSPKQKETKRNWKLDFDYGHDLDENEETRVYTTRQYRQFNDNRNNTETSEPEPSYITRRRKREELAMMR